jgi:hypothetical protein
MTARSLFLATLDDLDSRLQLGRGEYDALCMAWLLRRLFHPPARSLVSLVNEPPDGPHLALAFTVRDDFQGLPPPSVVGWIPIRPTGDGRATLDLTVPEFLSRFAVVVWPGNDQRERREVTVKQLILFLANNDGAVHWSRPNNPVEEALAEFRDTASYQTADGQYSGGVFSLIDVARVARDGLEPLRAELDRRISTFERVTGVQRR